MRMTPTSSKQQSNPDVKRAVIKFTRPTWRQLNRGQFHMYKLRNTHKSSPYLSLKREPPRSGS
eukprot:12873491-Ditylum_brightwellii.AAC.1